jgi:hypothetical protein
MAITEKSIYFLRPNGFSIMKVSAYRSTGAYTIAQQPVALPGAIPSHPYSGRWCIRKVFTFTPLRTSLMFMVGCSLRAVVMQFLTYFRLAGHLIFLPFASALHATVASFRATFSTLDVLAASTGVDVSTAPPMSTVAVTPAYIAVAK